MTPEITKTIEESLQRMYELGVEHGRQLAERDLKLQELKKEVELLKLGGKFNA